VKIHLQSINLLKKNINLSPEDEYFLNKLIYNKDFFDIITKKIYHKEIFYNDINDNILFDKNYEIFYHFYEFYRDKTDKKIKKYSLRFYFKPRLLLEFEPYDRFGEEFIFGTEDQIINHNSLILKITVPVDSDPDFSKIEKYIKLNFEKYIGV